LHEAIKGTRQIRVILYAKGEPFCAPPPADELPVEDILAVEHGVIPLDGADVFEQRAGFCRKVRFFGQNPKIVF